jgi:single-strand DNA-binding protein
MKNITIAGRLGKTAVLRRTQDGKPVLGFAVAVDDGYGANKKTMWFDCAMWGDRGEKIGQYLTKGTAVCVSGELGTREHEGKTYLQVRVNEVTLQGGGEKSGGQAADDGQSFSQDLGDSIPFVSWGDVPRHKMEA